MEEKEYDFIISEDQIGERIDIFLSQKIDISRALVQKLIADKMIQVNNDNAKPSYKLKLSDRLCAKLPAPAESKILPQEIPLKVVYEDSDIIVINKDPGIIVHPTASIKSGTLVNALLYHIKDLSSIGGEVKPGIVHRLDKDTSGLMMVAKNDTAHINLQKQIKAREVKKTYLALVFGELKHKNGIIEKPIGRHPVERKKMAVIRSTKHKSRSATTYFKVIEEFHGYSLLELDLRTGRTHQIRVHLSDLGHPIAGDQMYTRRKSDLNIERQLLHAYKLRFKHPVNGKNIELKADIPKDFETVLDKLRVGTGLK